MDDEKKNEKIFPVTETIKNKVMKYLMRHSNQSIVLWKLISDNYLKIIFSFFLSKKGEE